MANSRSRCLLVILGFLAVLVPMRVDAAGLDGFGRCLTEKGATFYGASWCPHCRAQRQTLGDAMAHVRYVECAGSGAPACKAAGVNSYPTWIFADGSRASGEASLAYLAAKTGCAPPAGSERPGKAPATTRPHAKMIEAPN
jgi:hypothetical protein